MHVASPVFDGATEHEVMDFLEEVGLPRNGKTILYDGRTEPFDPCDSGVCVLMKLLHLVTQIMPAHSSIPCHTAASRR